MREQVSRVCREISFVAASLKSETQWPIFNVARKNYVDDMVRRITYKCYFLQILSSNCASIVMTTRAASLLEIVAIKKN